MRTRMIICVSMALLFLHLKEKKVLAQKSILHVNVREADVAWSKRIWRVIDLKEKINLPLYYPTNEMTNRHSLFDVIKRGIGWGELNVYDPSLAIFTPDEEFKTKLSFAQAKKAFTREETIMVQDPSTNELTPTTVVDTIGSDDIVLYYIKEDWFFDKQRSVMDVRVLGIAPVIEMKDEQGEFKGYKTDRKSVV